MACAQEQLADLEEAVEHQVGVHVTSEVRESETQEGSLGGGT